MSERKRRRCGRDFRRRRRRGEPRRADIDAVVEIQLAYDFQERPNRLQVSLFQRNIGAAQRLGQPYDFEAGVVLRRIEPPLRQGLTNSATNRRRARLRVARNLFNAVPDTSRSKYASRRLIEASWRILPVALARRSELGFDSLDMGSLCF